MAADLELYTPEKQKEVLQLLGLSGPKNHIELLFQLGEKYQLDILTKEIALIPGKGPFIGVWGRLHVAHRSRMLDGLEMDDEWETDKHYCVRVVVWRKDMGRPAAKVIGRVGKHEGSGQGANFKPKEWPLEIARARGLRAALGFAFSIHDSYDQADEDDGADWVSPPDERVDQNGTVVGTVIPAAPAQDEEVTTQAPAAAAPKRARKVNKKTGEVVDVPGPTEPPTSGAEVPSPAPSPPDVEPPTVVVGGHTLAQKIAIAARDAGLDDDQTRHDVIRAASRGTYRRGSDIPEDGYDPDLVDRIFTAFDGLKTGAVELRYAPDGTPQLFKVKR